MISAGQVLVPSGSAVPLVTVPGGFQAALSVPGGTVYVGDGTSVTTTTGAPLSGFALLPGTPVTAAAGTLFAISASGTVACGVFLAGPR